MYPLKARCQCSRKSRLKKVRIFALVRYTNYPCPLEPEVCDVPGNRTLESRGSLAPPECTVSAIRVISLQLRYSNVKSWWDSSLSLVFIPVSSSSFFYRVAPPTFKPWSACVIHEEMQWSAPSDGWVVFTGTPETAEPARIVQWWTERGILCSDTKLWSVHSQNNSNFKV